MVGLATAWALERRGYACLVFEQGAPGGGQSAGESRIFRHSHDDPRQFELALQARRGWQEWEEEFDVELISPDGAMVIGDRAVARLESTPVEPGIGLRELAPADIRNALPPLAGFHGRALIDEAAGAIRTRLTLGEPDRLDRSEPRPGTGRVGQPRESGGGVDVVSSVGRRTFDAVVVAAGMGTVGLAATRGSRATRFLCVPMSGSLCRSGLRCRRAGWPAFRTPRASSGRRAGYGSPVRGNREYAVGLAHQHRDSTPKATEDPLSALAARTRRYVERALPGLDSSGPQELQMLGDRTAVGGRRTGRLATRRCLLRRGPQSLQACPGSGQASWPVRLIPEPSNPGFCPPTGWVKRSAALPETASAH